MYAPNCSASRNHRPGAANPSVVTAMGASIIILLGAVIYLLVRGGKDKETDRPARPEDDTPVVLAGAKVQREELPRTVKLDPPPKALEREDRIRETLQAGKTYRVVQKVGFAVRGEDPDWGNREEIKLGFMAELIFTRSIESNDGNRIVEVREIEAQRIVKILSGAADFTIDTGSPDQVMLTALDGAQFKRIRRIEPARPIVEAVVRGSAAAAVASDPATKVFGVVLPLSGKKVRITSINGKGVVGIEPLGCTLNASEREYFFNKDLLAYSRMFVDLSVKPGETWNFNASVFSELMELIDPSPRQRVDGAITVRRGDDQQAGGKHIAVLTIEPEQSELRLSESDEKTQVFGTLRPSGQLRYDLDDHYIRTAVMDGTVRVEEVPKGSPLNKTTFLEEIRLKMTYACEKR